MYKRIAICCILRVLLYNWIDASAVAQNLDLVAKTSLPPILHRSPIGKWVDGGFVRAERDSPGTIILLVYDRMGAEIQRASFKIEKASLINVLSGCFARSIDGYLAVAGSAYTEDSRGSTFLAVISPDGGQQIVVRTTPYAVTGLVFAADGDIWTVGRELVGDQETDTKYLMLRRYSRTGRLISAGLPRSEFLTNSHPAVLSHLVASRDRVGWYSGSAAIDIEFSLTGEEIGRYAVVIKTPDGVAICSDNRLWLSSGTTDADGTTLVGRSAH